MSMVNLMPPVKKESILYARRNSMLIKWVIATLLGAVGLLVVVGGSMFYLAQDTSSYEDSIAQSEAYLAEQNEKETLDRANEVSGNLELVVDVLSNQVLFSELLQQVGAVMPSGTILQDLSLSNTLDGGIDLKIGAQSEEAATQAQINLSDQDNNIFVKADIISLTCGDDADESGYPCSVSIRALFSKDKNSFLLLNKESAS